MGRVCLHRPGRPDRYLGQVEDDVRVYRHRSGPDDQIVRVDLENDEIHVDRLGADKYGGRRRLMSSN